MKAELLSIVRTVAPGIATALGGPLAGMAVRTLSQTLLGTPDAPQKDIEAALMGASPETMLKLKEANTSFEIEMEKLGVDLARIEADDRKDARASNRGTKDKLPSILAIAIIAGFFGTVAYVLYGGVELSGKDAVLIGTLVGYVSAKAEQVVSYYFGSSKGSSEKNATIAGLMK